MEDHEDEAGSSPGSSSATVWGDMLREESQGRFADVDLALDGEHERQCELLRRASCLAHTAPVPTTAPNKGPLASDEGDEGDEAEKKETEAEDAAREAAEAAVARLTSISAALVHAAGAEAEAFRRKRAARRQAFETVCRTAFNRDHGLGRVRDHDLYQRALAAELASTRGAQKQLKGNLEASTSTLEAKTAAVADLREEVHELTQRRDTAAQRRSEAENGFAELQRNLATREALRKNEVVALESEVAELEAAETRLRRRRVQSLGFKGQAQGATSQDGSAAACRRAERDARALVQAESARLRKHFEKEVAERKRDHDRALAHAKRCAKRDFEQNSKQMADAVAAKHAARVKHERSEVARLEAALKAASANRARLGEELNARRLLEARTQELRQEASAALVASQQQQQQQHTDISQQAAELALARSTLKKLWFDFPGLLALEAKAVGGLDVSRQHREATAKAMEHFLRTELLPIVDEEALPHAALLHVCERHCQDLRRMLPP